LIEAKYGRVEMMKGRDVGRRMVEKRLRSGEEEIFVVREQVCHLGPKPFRPG
jgi:hypothetical protein